VAPLSAYDNDIGHDDIPLTVQITVQTRAGIAAAARNRNCKMMRGTNANANIRFDYRFTGEMT
ncbi:MAG: hypothetical protein ACU0CQ_10795, partial [Sulfitobacter sp.]|uniref:hypothetical protein n=1 Tax=Sulfitobacter sp. TaxID=1903071 RepID=UPI004058B4CD